MLKRATFKALKGKVLLVMKAITFFFQICLSDIQDEVCTVKLDDNFKALNLALLRI